MAKKLFEKAGLIHLPPAPAPAPAAEREVQTGGGAPAEADTVRAKTAPGSMLQFMTAQSAAVKEAEALRERLAGFDGALPARRLVMIASSTPESCSSFIPMPSRTSKVFIASPVSA